MVAGFQALGTLMAVGMMMLPATAARFWSNSLSGLMVISTLIATLSGLIGLIVSYHLGVASGPAIVLTASAFYGF
ncbi:cation ABC transporter permease, partial [Pseudomonas syringae pv. actinidiae ICMP 18804]